MAGHAQDGGGLGGDEALEGDVVDDDVVEKCGGRRHGRSRGRTRRRRCPGHGLVGIGCIGRGRHLTGYLLGASAGELTRKWVVPGLDVALTVMSIIVGSIALCRSSFHEAGDRGKNPEVTARVSLAAAADRYDGRSMQSYRSLHGRGGAGRVCCGSRSSRSNKPTKGRTASDPRSVPARHDGSNARSS